MGFNRCNEILKKEPTLYNWDFSVTFAPCMIIHITTMAGKMFRAGSYFFTFATFLLASVACSGDDYSLETSGRCVVTNVTMGTLKRILHTTAADGSDSTYTVSVAGALYPMYIDQLEQRIFNPDSLPAGTDVSKVAFSTFTSTASMSIQSLVTERDSVFTPTDSTNFSVPRRITAYATDGTSRRTYTVEIRVHQEEGDSVVWIAYPENEVLATVIPKRAFAVTEKLFLFALDGKKPVLLTASTAAPATLIQNELNRNDVDVTSIIHGNETFFALANGIPLRSTDGITWTEDDMTLPQGCSSLDGLAVCGTTQLIAIGDGKFYSSSDGGQTWIEDLTDVPHGVPDTAIRGIRIVSQANPTIEDLVVVGTHLGSATIWKKNVNCSSVENQPWILLSPQGSSTCPTLAEYHLAPYDNGILLTGKPSISTNHAEFLLSYDYGNSWLSEIISTPKTNMTDAVITTDTNGFIYLYSTNAPQIWKGRLNRLGWKQEQEHFTK